ncbi:MAG: AI-2E family transporter [Candidatus Promineifilaceae bacterium]
MDNTWDASTRRYVAIGLVILLVFLIHLAHPLLPNLIIAAIMAFALAPVIRFLNSRLRFPKPIAILLSYILLILVILLLPAILIPAVAGSFTNVHVDLPMVIESVTTWLVDTLKAYRTISILGFNLDISPVIDQLLTGLTEFDLTALLPSIQDMISIVGSGAGIALGFAASIFGTVSGLVGTIFITFLISIFMSTDSPVLQAMLIRQLPAAYKDEILTLGRRIHDVWWNYIQGQVTLGFVIFLITWILGSLVGLPGAFALAVIAGLLEFVPNLGPLLAAIPAVLIALLQGSQTLGVSNLTFFVIVLVMYILIQQLENNLIVPKVLGDALDFPPVVVMVGVLVGFSVAGILGSLLAVPFMATGRELVAYAYAKVLMRDPFPPPDAAQAEKLTTLERLKVIAMKVRERAASVRSDPTAESTETAVSDPITPTADTAAVPTQEADS